VQSANDRARRRWTDAGLPVLVLHGARHTFASLMIAAGVNAKALSTYMGHANIAVTLDLYGHLMPGNEAEAADLLDAYLARAGGTAPVPAPDDAAASRDASTVARTVAPPAEAR